MKKRNWISLSILILLASCKGDENTSANFDRAAMLQNYAANIIGPELDLFLQELNQFEAAVTDFENNTDSIHLVALQNAFHTLAGQYQSVNWLNFGPGESVYGSFFQNTGVFPADTATVLSQIQSGNYNFINQGHNKRGLWVIEYILFSGQDPLLKFTGINGSHWLDGLAAASSDLKTRCTNLQSGWQNYENEFLQLTGTDVGSSTTMVYNVLLQDLENITSFKLSLPAGYYVGATGPNPALAEGYFNKRSLQYIEKNLHSLHDVWHGISANGNGLGFDDYLIASGTGEATQQFIDDQWEIIFDLIGQKPSDDMTVLTAQHPAYLENLYQEIRKLVNPMKAETSSMLGLAITFSDSDGD